jgi:hypothetical protein
MFDRKVGMSGIMAVVISLLAIMATGHGREESDLPANTLELFQEEDRWMAVEQAENLEIFLLVPVSGNWEPPPRRLADYQESESRKASQVQLAQFTRLMLDDCTYRWPKVYLPDGSIRISKKGCLPLYQIRAKLHRANRVVEVSFCLGCLDALVVENGKVINGSSLSEAGADGLLKIFLEIFPDDPLLNRVLKFRNR